MELAGGSLIVAEPDINSFNGLVEITPKGVLLIPFATGLLHGSRRT